MNTRPFATLGDTVRENWRAQMRAEGIERRPDPQLSRPDRGYVDQSPPVTPRLTMPLSKLQEARELSDEDWLAANDPAPPSTQLQAVRPDEEEQEFESYHEEPEPQQQSSPPSLVRVERVETRTIPTPEPSRVAKMIERAPETAEEFERLPRREVPMPEGVASVGRDGRKYYTEEFKQRVVDAAEAGAGKRTNRQIAEEFDIGVSNVTNWVQAARLARSERAMSEVRQASREAVRAERTLFSRPQPPSVPSPPSRARARTARERGIEDISQELAEAMERVKELKRELREKLED